MELSRVPNVKEKQILTFLVNKSSLKLPINRIDSLLIRYMNNEGMGILYLLQK